MFGDWKTGLLVGLETLNQILAAGISITAFSLLLYALTFNLRDRVARSFALILLCVVVVFSAEAIGSTAIDARQVELWLRLQWVGIIFLPPAYLHFSDALLATTGQPSRGRRRWAIRITYLISLVILFFLPLADFSGSLVLDQPPAPFLESTIWTEIFTVYYGACMGVAWFNFARAYRRTLSSTSRRRMFYLLAGATAPALGSFPFLLFGSSIAAQHPLMFWLLAVITNTIMGGLVVVMAYSVAFFGVPWPDRVVKSRLFKWLMRGPVTACIVLALTTVVRRGGSALAGLPYTAAVPIIMVGTILLLEYLITLFSPIWERVLFYGKDRSDLLMLRTLEERLLTTNDLRQFMEMILAAVCDRFQSHNAFVAAWNNGDLELVMTTGENELLEDENVSQELVQKVTENGLLGDYYLWGNYYLIPLIDPDSEEDANHILGLLGVTHQPEHELDGEQRQAMAVLSERAVLALRDRKVQQQIFHSLQSLSPDMDLIQNIRAAARYDGSRIFAGEPPAASPDLAQLVKDALTHYWGGPKLTESPLLDLEVVRQAMEDHDGNTANALRAILKEAIEKVRPEGERRFTGEWILYNILEMKFLEGRKVREIASRLAMSEADLYRKQRVAIDAVAHAIQEMEDEARKEVLDYDRTPIKGD